MSKFDCYEDGKFECGTPGTTQYKPWTSLERLRIALACHTLTALRRVGAASSAVVIATRPVLALTPQSKRPCYSHRRPPLGRPRSPFKFPCFVAKT